ncbi:DUF1697 domain-containing protein [Cellulomonas shaoxiangyii]|uniref:DUF1697 domain-containing protein n=1 Tax=Cellulomonas shaoxiangyii TaxID=2566013 RepID=A0A4V1CMI8_9CELL|nr:DUF1697 domain-containing protein [Cellulomonas shaoxiangyii]QCB93095.1 DUF1697 domain-containing protein [Cellulomonas shaoxiangyii]TGY84875.1 DUF1697 domain-containing protein [Cellulomonas shaoxiangyii]
MTVMVALLRGVNVGPSTRVPMAELRRVVAACGYGEVRTYVNSGNVVLTSDDPDQDAVAARLRDACAGAFPVRPDVVVRTRDELHAVVAANPFLDRDEDPTHHHVVFLPGRDRAALPDLDIASFHPEDLAAGEREVYLYLPHGMGRSALAARLAALKGPRGTARNWRTVTTLAAMADAVV